MFICRILLCSVVALFMSLGMTAAFAGVVINVSPNGSDDTANIENAFLSCVSSGPDCTVELAAGTFYIARPIVIANFHGVFRGQGKEQTIIENLHDVPFPLVTTGPEVGLPGMFYFYRDAGVAGNSLRIADFSIRAIGKSELWSTHDPSLQFDALGGIQIRAAVSGIEDFEPSALNVVVERIRVQGEKGDNFVEGFNLNEAVFIVGEQLFEQGDTIRFKYQKPLVGTFIVKESDFENIINPLAIGGLRDSTLVIGGKPEDGNTFEQARFPIFLADFDNSDVNVSFNKGKDVFYIGVYILNALTAVFGQDLGPIPELFPAPSLYSISHNELHLVNPADGLGLVDVGALVGLDATLNAVITNNKLALDNTEFGGIWGLGTQNAFVANNTIEGVGLAGVYFGVDGDLSEGWTLLGNNVQKFEGIYPGFSPGIWLGPWASNNAVVGGSNHSNVIDEGTDNIITGVNSMGGNPPGPAIAESIANKTALLKVLGR